MTQNNDAGDGLFNQHLDQITKNWQDALAFAGFDAAIVTAGEARNHFLDDQSPTLKLNPHFLQWCPSETAQGSALLIRPGARPVLFFLRADDYWHQPPETPQWAASFEVKTFSDRQSLLDAVRKTALQAGNHIALVGEAGHDALTDIQAQDVNPLLLLNHLHYGRALKTDFELDSMAAATGKAVRGHLAARDAFQGGASEFEINLAYLAGAGQLPAELPYQNIVALNEHAGVLHYQHYDRERPTARHSFLIDAGGSHNGYAADITRTYSAPGGTATGAATINELFGELIERLDVAQQALVETMASGTPYLELHVKMHQALANILVDSGLVTCSVAEAFDNGLTEIFLPHGLGHLIGLQTHDVGGQQSAVEGGTRPPPDNYAALRLTRTLADNMPVTIEPGLYFIPMLLDAARVGSGRSRINWDLIEQLLPCGGIRIEDNVYVRDGQLINLTRSAFAELG